MGLKKKYEELMRKHGLPDFDSINREFELNKIEDEHFLSRNLRRLLVDKIDSFLATLHDVIQPDTNAASMYESRVFDEAQKARIFEIFKILMYYKRNSLELEIIGDERSDCRFISEFYNEWQRIKPDVLKMAQKLRLSWKNLDDIELKMEYFG